VHIEPPNRIGSEKLQLLKIQDGGQPPSWKSKIGHISGMDRPIFAKFGTMTHIGPTNRTGSSVSQLWAFMFVVHTSNCHGQNCTRRAIFRLGIDTLIANILVIIIIRLHRSDSWRLQPFATDGVAWSVCLWVSLSVGHVCEPCNKRLNLSRCRWGRADLGGWEGTTFWGCPAHWKAWESLLRQEKSITSTAAAGGKPSALPVSH